MTISPLSIRSQGRYLACALAFVTGSAMSAQGDGPAKGAPAKAAPERFPSVAVGIEKCGPTVLEKYPGEILQVVLKTERGEPVWEIEIETADGKLYDIECSGKTGKIVETETRFSSADAAGFKEKVKISEDKARELALARYPGEVERVEYELEADGSAVYEFDIKPAKGHDWRVEVDVTTGKVKEAHPEWLEIGRI